MAKQIIAEDQLQVDDYVVEAAAFLHDTIDDKVVKDVVKAKEEVQQCLLAAGATAEQISHIFTIIENLSFSKELLAGAQVSSLEGQIVKDADRLDALGAMVFCVLVTLAVHISIRSMNQSERRKTSQTTLTTEKGPP